MTAARHSCGGVTGQRVGGVSTGPRMTAVAERLCRVVVIQVVLTSVGPVFKTATSCAVVVTTGPG